MFVDAWPGEGRLKQKAWQRPTTTACVVGRFRRFRSGRRQRSALAIRSDRSDRPWTVDVRAAAVTTASEAMGHGSDVHGACQGDDGPSLHEEGPQRMLEGGDGTGGVGEGGLEMGEDLGSRPVRRLPATGGSSGGGQRADSAVRILLWPRSNRFQMRCQVRSLRWQSAARMAARMLPATARWRNRHRQPVVRLSRRILSASQTLKVRPQPGRALRLLQKIRRARTVFCRGCSRQSRAKSRGESACRRPCNADRASA